MKPGLTGLWQVNARSDPRLSSRISFDLEYVHGWSLALDALILAKTVPAVIKGRGGLVDLQRPSGVDFAMPNEISHDRRPRAAEGNGEVAVSTGATLTPIASSLLPAVMNAVAEAGRELFDTRPSS